MPFTFIFRLVLPLLYITPYILSYRSHVHHGLLCLLLDTNPDDPGLTPTPIQSTGPTQP